MLPHEFNGIIYFNKLNRDKISGTNLNQPTTSCVQIFAFRDWGNFLVIAESNIKVYILQWHSTTFQLLYSLYLCNGYVYINGIYNIEKIVDIRIIMQWKLFWGNHENHVYEKGILFELKCIRYLQVYVYILQNIQMRSCFILLSIHPLNIKLALRPEVQT